MRDNDDHLGTHPWYRKLLDRENFLFYEETWLQLFSARRSQCRLHFCSRLRDVNRSSWCALMLLCLDAKVLTAIVMVAQLEVNCGSYLRNKTSTVYGSSSMNSKMIPHLQSHQGASWMWKKLTSPNQNTQLEESIQSSHSILRAPDLRFKDSFLSIYITVETQTTSSKKRIISTREMVRGRMQRTRQRLKISSITGWSSKVTLMKFRQAAGHKKKALQQSVLVKVCCFLFPLLLLQLLLLT